MAKKSGKKGRTGNKWQPQANDAIKLAAIRWFACAIEMEAIQIYATDSAKFEAISAALGDCVTKVHGLIKKPITGDVDCPPGYVLCGDECAPRCFFGDGTSRET